MNAKQRRRAYKAQYRTHGEEATQIYATAKLLGETTLYIPYKGHPDRVWRTMTLTPTGASNAVLCVRELCRELRRRDEYEAQCQTLYAPKKVPGPCKDHSSGL